MVAPGISSMTGVHVSDGGAVIFTATYRWRNIKGGKNGINKRNRNSKNRSCGNLQTRSSENRHNSQEDGAELLENITDILSAPNADISGEHADVKAICNTVWTDDVKAAWKTFKENEGIIS